MRLRTIAIGLLLSFTNQQAQSRAPAYSLGKVLTDVEVQGWRVRFLMMDEPLSNPPLIEDTECRASAPGIEFVVSSKGRAEVNVYAQRTVAQGGDLTLFDLVAVEADARHYSARVVSPNSTPKKVGGVIYRNTVPLVQKGDAFVALKEANVELPVDAFFAAFLNAQRGKVIFQKRGSTAVTYQVAFDKVAPLLASCMKRFGKPIRISDIPH